MAQWTFWEWVAYAIMFVAAIIIAADQGVKLAPDLLQKFTAIIAHPLWAFAPLVLVLVATGILVSREFGWIGNKNSPPASLAWPNPYNPKLVTGKTFINERVTLDGISYTDCEFTNITFVYNGTTPIQFSHNKVNGRMQFASDVEAVNGAWILLYAMGAMKPDMDFRLPPGTRIDPPPNLPSQPKSPN